MDRVSALPEPLPQCSFTETLAAQTVRDFKALGEFFQHPMWEWMKWQWDAQRVASHETALRVTSDDGLADLQLRALMAEMPLRIAYDRRVLAVNAGNPAHLRPLPTVAGASDKALADLLREGQAAAEGVALPGYGVWARVMTGLAWAHYYMLQCSAPSERAHHQNWVIAIGQKFAEIQNKVDLGVVAEAEIRKRAEETLRKETENA